MKEKWINRTDRPLTEVEEFINQFMSHSTHTDESKEMLRMLFRAGYCYHFAHILLAVFDRGQVVWAAPFGHICWQDEDGKIYDVEGEYEGEAYYFIPEDFTEKKFPGNMLDFKHIPHKYFNATKAQLINLMKSYCMETGQIYDETVEHFLGHFLVEN